MNPQNPEQIPPQAQPVILVATDLNETGKCAVRRGLQAASLGNATLHVVFVIDPGRFDGAAGDIRWLDQQLQEAPARLRAHVREVLDEAKAPRQRITLHVRVGAPAQALVQASVDLRASLVVVGSARRRGLEKLFLGSVAQEVLRTAHCPVLVALTEDYSDVVASPSVQPPMNEEEKRLHALFGHQHRESHVYEPSGNWGSMSTGKPTGMRIV
jgi:nucleotide-binding universal stress UspA family protein